MQREHVCKRKDKKSAKIEVSHSVICQNSVDMFCVFADSLTETAVQIAYMFFLIGLYNSLHLSIHNYIWKYFDWERFCSTMYYIDVVVFRPLNAKLLSFMVPSEVFSSRGYGNFILESQKTSCSNQLGQKWQNRPFACASVFKWFMTKGQPPDSLLASAWRQINKLVFSL